MFERIRPRYICDFDDVIALTDQVLTETVRDKFAVICAPGDLARTNLKKSPSCSSLRELKQKLLVDPVLLLQTPEVPGATNAVRLLANTFSVDMATGRASEVRDGFVQWLANHDLSIPDDIANLYLRPPGLDNHVAYKRMVAIDIHPKALAGADDDGDIILDYAQNGIFGCLIDGEHWNRDIADQEYIKRYPSIIAVERDFAQYSNPLELVDRHNWQFQKIHQVYNSNQLV